MFNFAPSCYNQTVYFMTFIERLRTERTNTSGNIIMYQDGSKFISMMERSAFMFCKVFKEHTPIVKNNKEYGGPYVTIGYPKEQLERYRTHDGYSYSSREDDGIVIHTLTRTEAMDFPEQEFIAWKEKAIAAKTAKDGQKKTVRAESPDINPEGTGGNADAASELSAETRRKLIIADIMQQPLADYTPMRALNYLNSLQERIRNEGV